MTNTHHTFGRLATVIALSVSLLACTVVLRAAAETPASLSKKELKTLSATPANHERLAAQHRRKKPQKSAPNAHSRATQPQTMESKRVFPGTCRSHYRYFSKLYAQEAK